MSINLCCLRQNSSTCHWPNITHFSCVDLTFKIEQKFDFIQIYSICDILMTTTIPYLTNTKWHWCRSVAESRRCRLPTANIMMNYALIFSLWRADSIRFPFSLKVFVARNINQIIKLISIAKFPDTLFGVELNISSVCRNRHQRTHQIFVSTSSFWKLFIWKWCAK